MKKAFIILGLLAFSVFANAQVLEPVTWSFSSEKSGDNSYNIIMKAAVDEGWHLYAMHIEEGGPIPTSFTFEPSGSYKLSGEPREISQPEVKYDSNFGMDIGIYSGSAEFRQKVIIKQYPAVVKGLVTFMSCDDKQCLPPRDVEFSVEITEQTAAPAATAANEQTITESPEEPVEETVAGVPEITTAQKVEPSQADVTATPADNQKKGLLKFFIASILLGFVGLLTPCVFPMIPLTVAFFSQGSEKKGATLGKALIFGFSIVLLYSSLGIIVSLTSAGAGFANTLSTHWIPNLIFFLLFLLFAASFFGAFEIVLPSKWINSSDSKVNGGGAMAAFFLGLTTVLVSFSCTGPIVGALLVEAASGDVLRPTVGMLGFGLAFALPFTLFALFPSWLEKMPKSGGWLNSVKVVLGFIMLIFSLKFLSTIDTVYSLGILSRDIYLAIWIVLFSLMGFYLLGKIKFRLDSDVNHIGLFRLFLVIVSFTFAIYLVPGLFGAPLTRISALLPPGETSGFNLIKTIEENRGEAASVAITGGGSSLCETPKYSDFLHFGNGLQGYFDLEEALACATSLNKPVLIDFKGHACANCKKMDALVWSDPGVQKRIKENFVLVGLYLDDRTKLEDNEVFVSKIDGKEKKTLGKKNEDIEISMFKTNSMPLYAIVDPNGTPLIETRNADFDIQAYIDWLDKGVKAFQNR